MATARDIRNTPDHLSIKAAFDDLLCAVGGSSRAGGYCRADQRRLSDYTLANTDAFAPVDVVADLERRAVGSPGWPQVTSELARQAGGTFVKLPIVPDRCADLLALLSRQAKESSDLTAVICGAIADGEVDDDEADAGVAECDQLISAVAAMRATLIAIRGRGQ